MYYRGIGSPGCGAISEQQSQKDFLGLRSSMPDGAEITAHTAEVLHLASNSGLPDLGGWVVETPGLGASKQQWKSRSGLAFTPRG